MTAVAISAVGAATCLGTSVHAAAAARAGIALSRELAVTLDNDETAVPVGHPMLGLTDGSEGVGRLARIGTATAEDLRRNIEELVLPRSRTSWFLALPRFCAAPIDPDEELPYTPAELMERVVASVTEPLDASASNEQVRTYPEGKRGGVKAIGDAIDALHRGRCDHAIVGAIDSMLDLGLLEATYAAGRLKALDNAVGYMPGEAGALLILEREETARTRPKSPGALVFPPESALDENAFAAERPAVGRALAEVVVRALSRANAVEAPRGTVYVDLNGEAWRAADWGSALARTLSRCAIASWSICMPASSFGDVGAAGPALALVLGSRSFLRGYARGPYALVAVAGDEGDRAAIVLSNASRAEVR
jgi:3-oxoacyl-[acyl-carrier-protein] synthase-1